MHSLGSRRHRLRPLCGWWLILLAGGLIGAPTADGSKVIFVAVYVDEEEAAVPQVWQARLGQRVEAASQILSRYADVRLAVSKFGTWRSENRIQDFSQSLREFEQRVAPEEARLAIGFSSQYEFGTGRHHLGGTRGPMQAHILIRENAPSIREPERLEVLVHELGHFFCAAHSAEPQSAMRPLVGDGQARAAAFEIGFDPINAKIIRLVAREIRDRKVRRFEELSLVTLGQLRPLYEQLARQLPGDPTARKYLMAVHALLDHAKSDSRPHP